MPLEVKPLGFDLAAQKPFAQIGMNIVQHSRCAEDYLLLFAAAGQNQTGAAVGITNAGVSGMHHQHQKLSLGKLWAWGEAVDGRDTYHCGQITRSAVDVMGKLCDTPVIRFLHRAPPARLALRRA